jgi:hypothetical protein
VRGRREGIFLIRTYQAIKVQLRVNSIAQSSYQPYRNRAESVDAQSRNSSDRCVAYRWSSPAELVYRITEKFCTLASRREQAESSVQSGAAGGGGRRSRGEGKKCRRGGGGRRRRKAEGVEGIRRDGVQRGNLWIER